MQAGRGKADSRLKKKIILQREIHGGHSGEAKYDQGLLHAAKSAIRVGSILFRAARPHQKG